MGDSGAMLFDGADYTRILQFGENSLSVTDNRGTWDREKQVLAER